MSVRRDEKTELFTRFNKCDFLAHMILFASLIKVWVDSLTELPTRRVAMFVHIFWYIGFVCCLSVWADQVHQ